MSLALPGLVPFGTNLAAMDHLQRARSRPALVVGTCGLIAAGVAAVAVTDAQAADRAVAFSLTAKPTPVPVLDLGAPGKTPGDLYVFSGTLTDAQGAPAGRVLGTQTSIALENQAETVSGTLTYELADGQIVIGGLSQYPVQGRGIRSGRTYVRPVLGGTGRYAGAHGSQAVSQGEAGSFKLRFALKIPAPAPVTTVTVRSPNGAAIPLDLGASGTTAGDLRVLVGDLTDAAGAVIGAVRGVQTTISFDGTTHAVQGSVSYQLSDGEIVVGGLSEQHADGSDLVAGREFVRPVLGGTGRYAGAGGTLTSVLGADRAYYDHRFALLGVAGTPKLAHTVRFASRRGTVTTVDLGAPGKTAGDLYAISSTLTGPGGRRVIGRLRGTQTSIGVEQGAETVQVSATFELSHGSVVVGGLGTYPVGGTGLVVGRRTVRAVLGGTGRYEGAHGTLTTVSRADGTYAQTLRFVR
jgi:hypothetical protein